MNKELNFKSEMLSGFQTAFINQDFKSNLAYRPEFLSNDHTKGKKVLVSIERELSMCDEFKISVAFITKSGITPLLQTLKELEEKGIPGKILTTDYLSFSEPEALEKLASLSNIELRMFETDDETGGFHTKGYIFRQEEIYRFIIGSSNMTLSAVTKNKEWNTKFVSTQDGEMAREILEEFDSLWQAPNAKTYEDFIAEYRLRYMRNKMIRAQRKAAMQEQIIEMDRCKLVPNKMQVEFVQNVLQLRNRDVDRAMLLSPTGTGKSFASAFAVRELKAKKALFLVHREQIAKQTIKSYKKIFGSSKTYGLVSGNSRELDADYLFSTMQMMTKPDIHRRFDPEEFDVIILDDYEIIGLSQEAA